MMLLLFLFLLVTAVDASAYLLASGSYTGNATDNTDIDISATTAPSVPDFLPDFVTVKCNAPVLQLWRVEAMGAGNSYSLASSDVVTTGIKAFTATGFQVGTGNANTNAVLCVYVAIKCASDCATGSYVGNSVDNRNLTISTISGGTVANFQPEMVIVQRDAGSSSNWRSSAQAGDLACFFSSTACAADRIQALTTEGFQVGSNAAVNLDLSTHFVFAIRAAPGHTSTGSFTGDTNDSRDITAVGFQPAWVFIKGTSANFAAAARMQGNTGDSSFGMAGSAFATNLIQSFLTTGFQVGTAGNANESTVTMYYYALKAQSARRGHVLFLD